MVGSPPQVNPVIRIQNIYHMLSYAFKVLQQHGYQDHATEEFPNTADLLAAILERGVSSQLRRGLGQEYVARTAELTSLRGKIELSETLRQQGVFLHRTTCSFDDFSEDTSMNRVLKATMVLLLRSNISQARRKSLRRLLPYFAHVQDVELTSHSWRMSFNRNNQTYRMLMNVCWLVYQGLLQTQKSGATRLMDFIDEQRMSQLYERFIREYFRQEHPHLKVGAPHISWALDDDFSDMLPVMKTDVTLSHDNRILIIDAKYYHRTLQEQFGHQSIHSANLYQIFTYVKNKEAEMVGRLHEVSGVLLYARTDEAVQPCGTYLMSGNRISVRALDLGASFKEIRYQLDGVVEEHFGTPAPDASEVSNTAQESI